MFSYYIYINNNLYIFVYIMSYFITYVKSTWKTIGYIFHYRRHLFGFDPCSFMRNVGQWYESMAIFNFIIDIIWCLDISPETESTSTEYSRKVPSDIVIFMPQSDKDAESFA